MRSVFEIVSSGICEQRRPRSDCASAQSDQGLCCSQTEPLDTIHIDCLNGKQIPGFAFVHVQDKLNLYLLRMPEGTFSHEAADIIIEDLQEKRCFDDIWAQKAPKQPAKQHNLIIPSLYYHNWHSIAADASVGEHRLRSDCACAIWSGPLLSAYVTKNSFAAARYIYKHVVYIVYLHVLYIIHLNM